MFLYQCSVLKVRLETGLGRKVDKAAEIKKIAYGRHNLCRAVTFISVLNPTTAPSTKRCQWVKYVQYSTSASPLSSTFPYVIYGGGAFKA